MSITDKNQV